MRLRLMQAGYRGKTAARTFCFAQFALGISLLALGALFVVLQTTTQVEVGIQKMLITGLVAGIVGYMIPKYWVTKRLQKRREEIENRFPDALDMMLVCVEAGQ